MSFVSFSYFITLMQNVYKAKTQCHKTALLIDL